jgi:hypothetical protein
MGFEEFHLHIMGGWRVLCVCLSVSKIIPISQCNDLFSSFIYNTVYDWDCWEVLFRIGQGIQSQNDISTSVHCHKFFLKFKTGGQFS